MTISMHTCMYYGCETYTLDDYLQVKVQARDAILKQCYDAMKPEISINQLLHWFSFSTYIVHKYKIKCLNEVTVRTELSVQTPAINCTPLSKP